MREKVMTSWEAGEMNLERKHGGGGGGKWVFER